MKKIFLLTIILLCITKFTAQTNIVDFTETTTKQWSMQDGDTYFKDVNNLMDPYQGTWKYTDGNKEFTLVLIKQIKYHYNDNAATNYYEDRLVGYYIYKENGEIIADTSSEATNNYGGSFLKVGFSPTINGNITGTINDYIKHKVYSAWFDFISSTQIKLVMKKGENHQIWFEGQAPSYTIIEGNTFPMEMILTKQ